MQHQDYFQLLYNILTSYKADKKPNECNNIADVRSEIDAIDFEILKLFGLRFEYVKEVVKYKDKTADSIVAAERREAVIEQRRIWAKEHGLNPDIIEEMYRNLIKHFIAEEMKILKIEPNK